MEIVAYSPALEHTWRRLFVNYFTADGEPGLPHNIIEQKICGFILTQWERGVVKIGLAQVDGVAIGFTVYQIDTPESDWCKRPGWGFLREFYIAPAWRRQGYGMQLAQWTEQQLYSMGAVRLYLTADHAANFWQCLAYTRVGDAHENGTFDFLK